MGVCLVFSILVDSTTAVISISLKINMSHASWVVRQSSTQLAEYNMLLVVTETEILSQKSKEEKTPTVQTSLPFIALYNSSPRQLAGGGPAICCR